MSNTFNIFTMKSRKLVRNLCNITDLKYKDFVKILTEKTGKKYTYLSFTGKINRDTFSYKEADILVEALGFEFQLVKKH